MEQPQKKKPLQDDFFAQLHAELVSAPSEERLQQLAATFAGPLSSDSFLFGDAQAWSFVPVVLRLAIEDMATTGGGGKATPWFCSFLLKAFARAIEGDCGTEVLPLPKVASASGTSQLTPSALKDRAAIASVLSFPKYSVLCGANLSVVTYCLSAVVAHWCVHLGQSCRKGPLSGFVESVHGFLMSSAVQRVVLSESACSIAFCSILFGLQECLLDDDDYLRRQHEELCHSIRDSLIFFGNTKALQYATLLT